MLARSLLLAVSLAVPVVGVAQRAATDTMRRVSGVGGRVHFAVPASWGILYKNVRGSVEHYEYVEVPGRDTTADSSGRDNLSAKIVVDVLNHPPLVGFRGGSDVWLRILLDSSALVLHDTIIGGARGTQRAVWYVAREGRWRWTGFADIARVGDIWVHVEFLLPLVKRPEDDPELRPAHAFEMETLSVLRSVVVDGRRAFSAPVGYPAAVAGPK